MIIVEGPDGGGKSTLVRLLSDYFTVPVAPRVVDSQTRPLTDLKKWTEENVSKGFQYTIFDRHRLISEPIYSPLKQHNPTPAFMDPSWLGEVMWQFYQCKPIIIYAIPPFVVVKNNVKNPESDNSAVLEWIDHIYAGYVNRATLDFCRGVGRNFNYTTSRFDDLAKWIELQLENRMTQHDLRGRIPHPAQAPDSASVPGQRRRTPQGHG